MILIYLSSLLLLTSAGNSRTLVILENVLTRDTHSTFLADLADKGQDVTYKYATDANLAIKKYGEPLYDNIVILAPSTTAFGNGITAADFVSFIDDGGNVVVSASSETGEPIRDLAAEVGLEIDEEGTSVIDHMNFEESADTGYHDLIVADNFVSSPVITGEPASSVLFRGVGIAADADNKLVVDILRAPDTAYSHAPDQDILEYPLAIGSDILMVAGMQARNNARLVIFGSHDMLSDALYNTQARGKESGNRKFVSSVMSWALKRNGNLRFKDVKHTKVGSEPSEEAYRITDEVEYSINIEEMVEGKWVPFKGSDVQLEFVMINPYIRTALKPATKKGGLFKVTFKVPDVYGVFQFKLDYQRIGYTHLYSTTQVSVRPFFHTEYDRFIPSAYPYYTSAFSMLGGLFLFSFVFLYHKDTTKTEKTE